MLETVPDTSGLSDRDFARIRDLLYRAAGIALSPAKKTLVAGRLIRRIEHVGARGFGDYFDRIESGRDPAERQCAIDLLTTNETYFWREARHFELARDTAQEAARQGRPFAVWSAASSSGEEAYTLAMVLDSINRKGGKLDWTVLGSDISTRVLERARRGLYPLERATQLPGELLHRYCRRGTGPHSGQLLIERGLRERVEFMHLNLVDPLPDLPAFDMIFLRNVMIYFDDAVKKSVVSRLLARLKPGGILCVGLAETLGSLVPGLESVGPGAYRRSGAARGPR